MPIIYIDIYKHFGCNLFGIPALVLQCYVFLRYACEPCSALHQLKDQLTKLSCLVQGLHFTHIWTLA